MEQPSRTHPSQEVPRKELRATEVKRSSWWPGRRGTAAANGVKNGARSPRSAEEAQAGTQADVEKSLSIIQHDTPYLPDKSSIDHQARDGPSPSHPTSRRNTRSDGGSVGSNMKKLSIDDTRNPKQPTSPTNTARTPKRAAEEPYGQVPDGAARPLKRPEPPSSIPHTKNANNHDRIAAAALPTDDSPLAQKSPTGIINLRPPLAPQLSARFNSTSSSTQINYEHSEAESKMLLQPETRPITQDQLVNEVKGIYAGLVMVEKKCVEIDLQQSKTTTKLSDEQWQALIALHRTLLYEHHDFFLASQHPSSSAALRRLATKYAMPARMWRHGIHSFLELLRHRLPDSLDHMLAFVYLAYSMMALLMESVPSFVETWIECLGDLARYRMAIEEIDLRDREIWSGCAKMWYEKAADKSPDVGRIQHHLAVLARPNIVQQLFYYSKALLYWSNLQTFLGAFDAHIGRTGSKFRVQGPEIVSSLCAAAYDFGNQDAALTKFFHKDAEQRAARDAASKESGSPSATADEALTKMRNLREYWSSLEGDPIDYIRADAHTEEELAMESKVPDTNEASAQAVHVLGQITKIVAQRIGDKNIVPYMHVQLAFLWSLAHVPGALLYVQGDVPWEDITIFLSTLGRSNVDEARVFSDAFPQHFSGTGRQLPEDFPMRGLTWAQHYFPPGFFQGQVIDEDERTLDLPSHAGPRAERCLWLGVRLASLNRWITFENGKFSVTDYAKSLAVSAEVKSIDSRSNTLSVHSDKDTPMLDIHP